MQIKVLRLSLQSISSGVEICEPTSQPIIEAENEDPAKEEIDPTLVAMLKERFSFVYPYEHVSDLPAKLSISSLYPAVLDESGDDAFPEHADIEELLDTAFVMPEHFSSETKANAADRGTATHTFLQFCDFDRVLSVGVKEELARLSEARFIAPKTADLVNVKQLEAFFQSKLFTRLQNAEKIYREQRFNLFLPASDFTEQAEKAELLKDETIAVQGVIDLFFVEKDGSVILCDYKTDYLTREELAAPPLAAKKLRDRHAQQLRYYAMAIEAMLGHAPREVLIYSLPLGDTVKVKF